AANYNQDFAVEQQNVISNYKKELDLPYYKIKGLDFDKIIENFDNKNKYIVFLEIFTLILADEKYDDDEQKFMNKLQEAFGISDEKKDEIGEWIIDFIEVHNRAQKLIDTNS
ncbi:MAG: hypothetical protein ACQEQF_10495, partial [Bacillota bacterium]